MRPETEKFCPKCKQTKPAADFYARSFRRLSGYCRECTKQATRARNQRVRAKGASA